MTDCNWRPPPKPALTPADKIHDSQVLPGQDRPQSAPPVTDPKVRYCLDPREVWIIRDPERDGEVIGYVWEPTGPVPQPVRADTWANPRLIGRSESRRERRRRLGLRWWQREAQ